MIVRIVPLAAVVAVAAAPALASQWDDAKALCVEAIGAEAGLDTAAYRSDIVRARAGGVSRLTVRLTPSDGGQPIVAECRLRGKTVSEIDIRN